MHKSLTLTKMVRAAERYDGSGFCAACGRKAGFYVDPDGRKGECEFGDCGENAVYGAEELVLYLY